MGSSKILKNQWYRYSLQIETPERFFNLIKIFLIGIVLWGALVRATRSGEGCGATWPLCHGALFPLHWNYHTWIEWIHRATSGVALLVVTWGFVKFEKQSRFTAINCALWGLVIFMVLESLVGAAIVLFGWVGMNPTLIRAVSMGLHSVITLGLLSMAQWGLTSSKYSSSIDPSRFFSAFWSMRWGLVLWAIVAAWGALAALACVLYEAPSLSEAFRMDFDPKSHFSVKLRIFHPIMACSLFLWTYCFVTSEKVQKLLAVNLLLGLFNWIFMAPLLLQLSHLFVACWAYLEFNDYFFRRFFEEAI